MVPIDAVEAAIEERMAAARGGIRRPELLSLNKAALREGAKLMADHEVEEEVSAS